LTLRSVMELSRSSITFADLTLSIASCNGVKVSLQFLWIELIHFTQQGVSWLEQKLIWIP
jgi:hypothetical protein